MKNIDKLIICDPYQKPNRHWRYNDKINEFEIIDTRRPSKYKTNLDTYEQSIIDKIRDNVDSWRNRNYPNVTNITRELLNHWNDTSIRDKRFFFCQLEAIETLIWLIESPEADRMNINISYGYDAFKRHCCKMATGTGKTVVMAMLIAWQILNKVVNSADDKYTKNILIVTPGLTVKSRLEVLYPHNENNYYDLFDIVPESLHDNLHLGNIMIKNWHQIKREKVKTNIVVKQGEESDERLARRILKHNHKDILVINDEAHHVYKDTVWMKGLNIIHNARNITRCYDFSATPFQLKKDIEIQEDKMFDWVVSDFSLIDAIESGLTKTPTIAIKDNKQDISKFYHLYQDESVKKNLNTKDDTIPLPPLVIEAYNVLGEHYLQKNKRWKNIIPPVMITVCNMTNTAKRISDSFRDDTINIPILSNDNNILHIDSVELKKAESKDIPGTMKEDTLRDMVNTVGKEGESGEQIRNVITVDMLSEGWDAHNVTHIMGLRAFSSELLCEQIIGRGLRRMSYDIDPKTNLLLPEYVHVMGIPFAYLPHEVHLQEYKPQKLPIKIGPIKQRMEYEISWPNIDRINCIIQQRLTIDWDKVKPIMLIPGEIVQNVTFSPIIDGKPFIKDKSELEIKQLYERHREQTIIFQVAEKVISNIKSKHDWINTGDMYMFSQVVELVQEFIKNKVYFQKTIHDDILNKVTIWCNMQEIVTRTCDIIKSNNIIQKNIMINHVKPTKSTSDMRSYNTTKNTIHTKKSHLSHAVCDSSWESDVSHALDKNDNILSWFKNYNGGFMIPYRYDNTIRQYIPDFIVKLKNGIKLVLEVKPRKDLQDVQNKKKFTSLDEWITCVCNDDIYGKWSWNIISDVSKIHDIINSYNISDTRPKCVDCRNVYVNCNCK